MKISFNQVPENLRTHGSFIEFDNSQNAVASQEFQKMLFGQRLQTGIVPANVPTRVTRPGQGAVYFGKNSYLASMCDAALKADETVELWVMAQDDNPAGVAATATITINTTTVANSVLNLYVAGERVQVSVEANESVASIATKLASAINDHPTIPVTAVASSAVVTVTARNKGEVGNDLDIRLNYYEETMPSGMTVTIAPMSGGAGNPDLAPTIAALGDDWYQWFVNPYTDAANLVLLRDELADRWGPLRQIDGRAFMAVQGTLSAASAFGNARNSQNMVTMGTNGSPTPTYIWATVLATVAGKYLSINPVRPLQTLALTGVLPPKRDVRWTRSERNLLLFDGISTFTVDHAGIVRIDHVITMYQTNDAGFNDTTWLDLNDVEFDSRLRYAQRALIAQRFPRHSLSSDEDNVSIGSTVVTPNVFTVAMLGLYKAWVEKGWAEDYDNYKATFFATVNDADKNRLDWQDRPNRVNQARVFAGKMQIID